VTARPAPLIQCCAYTNGMFTEMPDVPPKAIPNDELNSPAMEETFATYRLCFLMTMIMSDRTNDAIRHSRQAIIRNSDYSKWE
jgi:hypothetical protein